MEESTIWRYIDKKKSKTDIIDEEGFVFGHIGHYKLKDQAKRAASGIKKVWPSINFKLIGSTKRFNEAHQEGFDLYGDYLKFYKLSEIMRA